MEKITIILFCAIFTVLAGKLPEISKSSSIKAELIDELNAVLLKNSEIIELNKELIVSTTENNESRQIIRYTLGEPHPADKRLAEVSDAYYYQIPQDFRLQLTYPEVGVGGIVKYVEILVDQSSNIGQSYIIAGGLGERFIRILVEAKQITHFHYRATFYGI